MLPSSLTNSFIFIALAISLTTSHCEAARTRLRNTLDVKFNLGCHLPQCNSTDTEKPAVNLFQIVSSNPESSDKTNYLLSNIGGPPMVITASSSQSSNLLIDWEVLLNKKPSPDSSGFHFDITQDGSIGLLIEKIIFFDDTNQNGLFTKDKKFIEVEWSDIIWDLASRTTYHKNDFLKTNLRIRPKHQYLNGNIVIKLAIPRDYKADRQKEVPHLKLNNQSISVVIVVDGIQPPPDFKNTRLTMTFVVVVQTPNGQAVSLDTDSESLISDEYTPGIFRIKSLQFKTKPTAASQAATPATSPLESIPDSFADIEGQTTVVPVKQEKRQCENLGFLYWKEVAYADRRKMISRTIDVSDSEIAMSLDTLPNISPPFYQYFKYKPATGVAPEYKLYRFELIFGKDNASYSATNFTDFSFVFGLGASPRELMFSFLVKLIIFFCFCLPILVMLSGLMYMTLRRFNQNSDTELLLASES